MILVMRFRDSRHASSAFGYALSDAGHVKADWNRRSGDVELN